MNLAPAAAGVLSYVAAPPPLCTKRFVQDDSQTRASHPASHIGGGFNRDGEGMSEKASLGGGQASPKKSWNSPGS